MSSPSPRASRRVATSPFAWSWTRRSSRVLPLRSSARTVWRALGRGEAANRAVTALARCALRHGGLEQVTLTADGPRLVLVPVTAAAAPVLLGEELRDLGAAVAVRQLRAQGGSVELDGERLIVALA